MTEGTVKILKLGDDIRFVKGVGEKRAKVFSRLGIETVSDLLYHLPRGYEDRSKEKKICDLIDGERVCVRGRLTEAPRSFRSRGRLMVTQAQISDGTGIMKITWFNAGYVAEQLKKSGETVFFGTVAYRGHNAEMVNPVIEKADSKSGKAGRLVPVYPLTSGLSQNNIRSAEENALKSLDEKIGNIVPEKTAAKYGLFSRSEAIRNIHMPDCGESFLSARHTLAFEELLIMQTGIRLLKENRKKYSARKIENVKCVSEFAEKLPFSLTDAQKRVINEICSDIKKDVPMNRLVQGDVGSGKTAVAAAAIYAAVKSGFQAAMLAPTEILAKQHFKTLCKMFEGENISVALLTGGNTKGKKEALSGLESGEIQVAVGTHAVLTDKVKFKNLNLAITDEQHRFGVKQRASLAEKGKNVHTIVMTATPIPRTLSLILYGDLDISVIDSLPAGRKEVRTFAVGENMRQRINRFIGKKIAEGRQVYIVCPLVEESEALSAKAVTEYAETLLKSGLGGFRIDVLHGKMNGKEKESVMERFSTGETDILVTTTVVEVGVDVPNATVMVVENAERFGLSQLHQLRGRIRRGSFEGFCILFCNSENKIAKERMKIMEETSDGFKISEKDLILRGPGEFFGIRQHGLPELKIADLSEDMELLKNAKDAADELVSKDARLELPENKNLRRAVLEKYEEVGGRGILN